MPELDTNDDVIVDTESPNEPVETTYTGEDLNRIVEREKNKLYNRLTKESERARNAEEKLNTLESQLKDLQEFREKAELEKLGEKERLERQILKLQEKTLEAEKQLVQKESVLQERIRLYEVAQYRANRIIETNLDPDFYDFVNGNTEEEIEAAIVRAKEKEARFKEKFSTPRETPRTPPRSNPGINPAIEPGYFNLEEALANARNETELNEVKKKMQLLRSR
jgi:DNA repair exonuclease SbcCD ATPase subunit